MVSEDTLREKLATCTRIFAMQGLLGLFGHISIYQPESKRVLMSPGLGSDKATMRPDQLLVIDLSGGAIEGEGPPPIEWPIHTALHGARKDALAVAHLHPPYATLFSIAKREFKPVTLQGALFGAGIPVYRSAHLIKTPERGQQILKVIGDNRALLLRGHGTVVVGRDIEEALFASLILEDDARKAMQSATLGEWDYLTPEECREFEAEIDVQRRAHRAWSYLVKLESRWDRQPATGLAPLA
ncbi:MAG: class II aldolase/adducin family protein [Deltaproteobacteria bacterium]|nr:class II aldolase/adducin family protein [Deltaproteobacteria bacterium]